MKFIFKSSFKDGSGFYPSALINVNYIESIFLGKDYDGYCYELTMVSGGSFYIKDRKEIEALESLLL